MLPDPTRPRVYQSDLPEAGAQLVTTYHGGKWHTRIVGGRLDGCQFPARDRAEARHAHRWAARLAVEAAGISGAAVA